MKHLRIIPLTILIYGSLAFSQVSNPTIIPVSVAPSGSCTNGLPLQLLIATGVLYSCQNGTWGVQGTNGGSLSTTAIPGWLQNIGTGADGSNTNASGNLIGDKYYTNFTVPNGNTVTVNVTQGLVIHATGTCTIAGTITGVGQFSGAVGAVGGGGSGGSGGGTAGGTAGINTFLNPSANNFATATGGTAGASSGGAGGAGNSPSVGFQRYVTNSGGGADGAYFGGSRGSVGGSSGGAAGNGGTGLTLICASITGTDGVNTGIIDMSGVSGIPAAANTQGGGSGGGGGVVVMSSQSTVATWPAVYTAPGGATSCTVPEAAGQSGTCTTEPLVTLAVSAGALSGTCTVVTAGVGCGTGTNVTFPVVGGGGTQGTGAVVPVWAAGALSSCTITSGSSTGYTAATFTTCGAGAQGAAGWYAEFANGVQIH